MTLQNRKKRYEHFVKIGDEDRAKELADKYPDVKGSTPKEEAPKSKGKK
jgi:hypothetical protein|tara:strand:- start:23 stop:169 length:147 start_codon:yes stop_codon:yes gene_type:complete